MTPAPAFAFILLLAPVLQGVFDLTLQLAFQQAALLSFLAWLWLRPPSGGAAALAAPRFRPLWAAAGLSLTALLFSPLRSWLFNEWGNFGTGLLIFAGASFLDRQGRALADRAAVAGAWLVFALAAAQFLFPGRVLSPPPLTNYNALALYALLVMPFAVARGNKALAAAMGLLLLAGGSAGGRLALGFTIGWYTLAELRARRPSKLMPLLLALAVFCIITPLLSDSVSGRLAWWQSAWKMFLARPLGGFGYAGYTWAQAGFQQAGAFREHSIYAHDYYLEFLAENGLPAALAWFWCLAAAVRRRRGLVKYSLIAALLHSFVDFGLSVPANFWLFCYLAAEPAEPEAEAPAGAPLSSRAPLFRGALVLALLLEAGLLALCAGSLAFDRARAAAVAAAPGGRAAAEAPLRPFLASGLFRGPALELLGRLCAGPADEDDGFSAAAYYEQVLLDNPYSAVAWRGLERIYAGPGTGDAAAGLELRRRKVYR